MSVLSTAAPISHAAAERSQPWFARFALLVLLFNIPVILWGAYVRVSYSGDGCGAHWPTCNGQFVPQKMSVPTAVEYAHRMMTSVDTVLVVVLCGWAFFAFPKRHAVRRYSLLSLVFLLIEALLGAGLVLFRYVARNQSAGRAWYLSAHLTNTLLLMGALTATAWLARNVARSVQWRRVPCRALFSLLAIALTAVTGAVTALGDTLFPANSLETGIRQDFASTSSALLRLRVIHPILAVAAALYIIWVSAPLLQRVRRDSVKTAAGIVVSIVVCQLMAGMVNTSLLAPVWMQLTHLFIADLLWIAMVVLALEQTPRNAPLTGSILH